MTKVHTRMNKDIKWYVVYKPTKEIIAEFRGKATANEFFKKHNVKDYFGMLKLVDKELWEEDYEK